MSFVRFLAFVEYVLCGCLKGLGLVDRPQPFSDHRLADSPSVSAREWVGLGCSEFFDQNLHTRSPVSFPAAAPLPPALCTPSPRLYLLTHLGKRRRTLSLRCPFSLRQSPGITRTPSCKHGAAASVKGARLSCPEFRNSLIWDTKRKAIETWQVDSPWLAFYCLLHLPLRDWHPRGF